MKTMKMMTETDVLSVVAEAIAVPADRLTPNSTAAEIAEWDSMGTLALLTILDRNGVKLEPGDAAGLQSVQGVLDAVRKAGKLA